jgi:hypothetical protein
MIDIDEKNFERQYFARRYYTMAERIVMDDFILEDRQDNCGRLEQNHPMTCACIDEEDL